MAKKKKVDPLDSPNRYTIVSVTLHDHALNKEVVVPPCFEIMPEEKGYCGYMEPAKAFLSYDGRLIKVD